MSGADVYEKAAQAAEGTALPTEELLGEVFTIESFRTVKTQFGERQIAKIRWPCDSDDTQEAWLSGVVLSRQLDAIKDDLPADWTLVRADEPNAPYRLVAPSEKPASKPRRTLKERISSDDPLDYFRLGNGKLDTKAFVEWWQGQGLDADDLCDVVGATTASAIEDWFAADPTRTVETLLAEAKAAAETDIEYADELPFE